MSSKNLEANPTDDTAVDGEANPEEEEEVVEEPEVIPEYHFVVFVTGITRTGLYCHSLFDSCKCSFSICVSVTLTKVSW